MKLRSTLALLFFPIAALAQAPAPAANGTWHFIVAGDSRNCGDVVMPAIAEAAKNNNAKFYWHLGDWRAIYTFDEDMVQAAKMAIKEEAKQAAKGLNGAKAVKAKPLLIQDYLKSAFQDAIDNQLKPFDDRGVPVFVGIGNHETIWPMSRDRFVKTFSAYLDIAPIRDQRLKDDPSDTAVRTYYHVVTNGIDFITLDNGSCDMFDDAQMAWLRKVLASDAADASIRTVVLGAHAALPDSRSCGHSMGNYPQQEKSGREVYDLMLAMRDKSNKQVYVLASHSHFVMNNVYDSDYWRKNGGVLPGWIVGTSGAVRYRLPETATPGPNVRTDVYGYLLGTVGPTGAVTFEFRALRPKDIPAGVVKKYSKDFVENFCFAANRDLQPQHGYCPPMSKCSTGD